MPPSSQSAFSSVFANLVSVGSLEHAVAVRKPALLAPESGTPAAKEFIAQFVSARLLTADRSDDGQPVIRVAHEALLRHWPRLKNWIEENRDFLRLRARIENAALIWDEEQRSEDFLLPRGKPLLEATQLQKARSVDLLPLEQLFISTSIARANRRRHQSVGIAVVVICVALGLALWGIRYRRERSKPTVASKLAEEALHHRAQFDVFSLLAVQSYRMADTYETRNALLSALEANFFIGSLPGRWGVKTISFSPDGKHWRLVDGLLATKRRCNYGTSRLVHQLASHLRVIRTQLKALHSVPTESCWCLTGALPIVVKTRFASGMCSVNNKLAHPYQVTGLARVLCRLVRKGIS